MDQKIIIATHNGYFHADDIIGVAILLQLHPGAEIVRTRDPETIAKATFAVDVGGEWDPSRGRFDHHQKGFAGSRANGTVYASAGLVWREFGEQYVCRLHRKESPQVCTRIAEAIDRELIEHVDRADTGAAQGAPGFFGLSAQLASYNPPRLLLESLQDEAKEDAKPVPSAEETRLSFFRAAVFEVNRILTRLVNHFASQFADEDLVRNGQRLEGGRVLVLDKPGLDWEQVVTEQMPDVLFVLYPDSTDQQYQLRTVRVQMEAFDARKDLPAPWAGLRGTDLAAVTGVPDSVFCHNGRFIAGAGSKAGALKLAQLALAA